MATCLARTRLGVLQWLQDMYPLDYCSLVNTQHVVVVVVVVAKKPRVPVGMLFGHRFLSLCSDRSLEVDS